LRVGFWGPQARDHELEQLFHPGTATGESPPLLCPIHEGGRRGKSFARARRTGRHSSASPSPSIAAASVGRSVSSLRVAAVRSSPQRRHTSRWRIGSSEAVGFSTWPSLVVFQRTKGARVSGIQVCPKRRQKTFIEGGRIAIGW